jgi:hypothetical protein
MGIVLCLAVIAKAQQVGQRERVSWANSPRAGLPSPVMRLIVPFAYSKTGIRPNSLVAGYPRPNSLNDMRVPPMPAVSQRHGCYPNFPLNEPEVGQRSKHSGVPRQQTSAPASADPQRPSSLCSRWW